MKIFAVIDTNVIVSALISRHTDSATVMVLNSVFSEHIIPVYNEDILNEYATVLRRKKFNFSEDFINETITTIKDKRHPLRKGQQRRNIAGRQRPCILRSGTESRGLISCHRQPEAFPEEAVCGFTGGDAGDHQYCNVRWRKNP